MKLQTLKSIILILLLMNEMPLKLQAQDLIASDVTAVTATAEKEKEILSEGLTAFASVAEDSKDMDLQFT
jgi:hypothetical protein